MKTTHVDDICDDVAFKDFNDRLENGRKMIRYIVLADNVDHSLFHVPLEFLTNIEAKFQHNDERGVTYVFINLIHAKKKGNCFTGQIFSGKSCDLYHYSTI